MSLLMVIYEYLLNYRIVKKHDIEGLYVDDEQKPPNTQDFLS